MKEHAGDYSRCRARNGPTERGGAPTMGRAGIDVRRDGGEAADGAPGGHRPAPDSPLSPPRHAYSRCRERAGRAGNFDCCRRRAGWRARHRHRPCTGDARDRRAERPRSRRYQYRLPARRRRSAPLRGRRVRCRHLPFRRDALPQYAAGATRGSAGAEAERAVRRDGLGAAGAGRHVQIPRCGAALCGVAAATRRRIRRIASASPHRGRWRRNCGRRDSGRWRSNRTPSRCPGRGAPRSGGRRCKR